MSFITAQAFVRQGETRLGLLRQSLEGIEHAEARHREKLEELRGALEVALDELTALYLSALTREAVDRVRELTGYGQFSVRDPIARLEEERVRLPGEIRAIETDERYIRRDELIHPVTGSITSQISDIEQQTRALEEGLDRFIRTPNFNSLVNSGYDTPDYPHKWWNSFRFYNDWKHADECVERLGFASFREAREEFIRLREAKSSLESFLPRLRREQDEVVGLASRHDALVVRLGGLEEAILAECRLALKEHLKFVDREQLFTWSTGDRSREALIKRVEGIEKKIDYLDELAERTLGQDRARLSKAIAKLGQKVSKYSRSKYQGTSIDSDEANGWLGEPPSRYAERRERFWRDYEVIYVFDNYSAYDYARDLLWWDVITDGRIDGNFIPEVQAYRAEHPEYTYTSPATFSSDSGGIYDPS